MVLTNFKCWANAAGGAADIAQYHGSAAAARHVDPFNPRAVQQTSDLMVPTAASVSHISSNGYYGFCNVNTAATTHEPKSNYNNLNTVSNMRCKKRTFVNNEDAVAANNASWPTAGIAVNCDRNVDALIVGTAKRCRYDDDFTEQYFNDFFNMQYANNAMPNNQIGTQFCLMDTDDCTPQPLLQQQQQQQHVQAEQQRQQLAAQQQTDLQSILLQQNAQ